LWQAILLRLANPQHAGQQRPTEEEKKPKPNQRE
jgi:hypothetical protein